MKMAVIRDINRGDIGVVAVNIVKAAEVQVEIMADKPSIDGEKNITAERKIVEFGDSDHPSNIKNHELVGYVDDSEVEQVVAGLRNNTQLPPSFSPHSQTKVES